MLYVDPSLVLADAWAACQAEDRAGELAKLADLIADDCHPRQRAFVVDESNRIDGLVGRGGGKTTGADKRLLRKMVKTPGANCLFLATTRDQAEKLLWAMLKADCEKFGIPARFYEDRLRMVMLHNGATLTLAGADDKKQIEKYRGIPHHEVVIDECASFPPRLLEHLIERVIIPRLGDYNGSLVLIGTPGHIQLGPFYDVTRPGAEAVGWSSHRWTLEDAAKAGIKAARNLWAAALKEKANKGWSDDHPVWRREYLGQWAADDTERVYYGYRPHDEDGKQHNQWGNWDPETDPQKGKLKVPPGADEKTWTRDWCFAYGIDVGNKDPTAIEVFAYNPTDPSKVLWHVYEYERRGTHHARVMATLLIGSKLDIENPAGLIGQTSWPEVISIDGSAQTLIDELLNVYGIKVEAAPRKQGDKLDSIELANGDLQDGRIKILKGSRLEEQLSQLQWVLDENGGLKEDKGARNDCADAFIYARRGAKHLIAEPVAEKEPYFPVKEDNPSRLPWEKPADPFAELYNADAYDDEW